MVQKLTYTLSCVVEMVCCTLVVCGIVCYHSIDRKNDIDGFFRAT